MLNLNTFATIVSTVSIAIAGWFGVTSSSLQTQITANATSNAKLQQQIDDIDARTTRIENKLDAILGGNRTARNI